MFAELAEKRKKKKNEEEEKGKKVESSPISLFIKIKAERHRASEG